MKKKVLVVVNFIVVGIILFLISSLFIFSNLKKQVIVVENQEVYEELKKRESLLAEVDAKISLVTTEEFRNLNLEKNWLKEIFSRKTVLIGRIFLEKNLGNREVEKNAEVERKSKNQIAFKIQETKYIPSVKLEKIGSTWKDFDSRDYGKAFSEIDVEFTTLNNFPLGNCGLKVDGKYVTDSEYPLVEKTYLVWEAYFEDFEKVISDFLENFLLDERSNIKLIKESSENPPIFITGVGDVMVGRGVQEILIYDKKEGLNKVFTDTLPILQNSDLTLGNLEGAVTYFNEILPKSYNFKFDKKVLNPLKLAGFDYLMINNNHVFDYGLQGFLDSLAALKEAGIGTSGVGKNLKEASEFFITEIRGQKIAILSVGNFPKEQTGFDGANVAATEEKAGILWKNEKIYEDIKSLKSQGMLIVVCVHDGFEYNFVPSKAQRSVAEKLIDAGASLVLESHTHILQPIEWYKNGIIAYGLGNFIFPGMEEIYGATESLILRVGFVEGKPIYVEPFPCIIEGTQVRLK